LVCALGLLSAHGVSASEREAKRLHLVSTQAYTYGSKIMDRSHDVIVSVPHGYESNPQTKDPALLLTDGHNTLRLAFGAWSYLAESGEIRQPILVSIGSPATEGRAASYRRRLYEFSPPDCPMTDPAGKVLAERIAAFCTSGNRSVSEACTGGAPRFFKFLTTELLPELVKSYRIEADDLGLYGHSAGGFFALWVMFQGDDRFKRFI